MTPPAFMVEAVTTWLKDLTADDIRTLAQQQADAATPMIARYPVMARRFAKGYLGPEGVAQLRQAGDADWTALINIVAYRDPTKGAALLAHEHWFQQQLSRARDLFLAS